MADPQIPSSHLEEPSAGSISGESKAQREARLRRERRNAKIQAGGSERLSKITSLSGRPAAAEAELNRTPPAKTPSMPSKASFPAGNGGTAPRASVADDPDEVDISNMFARGPPTAGTNDSDAAMREQQDMLRAMLRAPEPGTEGGNAGGQQNAQAEDPLMQMMQQMLGGGGSGGADGTPGQPGGLPPGLAELLSGQGPQNAEEEPASSGDYLWRIIHVLCSLLLGVYAASTLAFTGSRLERVAPSAHGDIGTLGTQLFYLFATVEVVLQTTRYLVDRGRLPSSGLIATAAGFLPRPWSEYLRMLNRYSIIYTTVSRDAFVLIFILGVVAWWKSGATDALDKAI